jgi:class 3 adenylate cyclase/tetratricopeptide (TPR) repeat protein
MQQIADWLKTLGMSEYAERFAENGISIEALPHLTDQDLKDIGVLLGHRRILLAAISKRASETPPTPEPIDRAEPKPQDTAELRQVTVMFSDLVGSTALSAHMDPEDLREVISAYQRSVAETIRRFDGFVAKYMGDGVLVYFGYPQAHEDDAERAVRAGLELIRALAALGAQVSLQTRIGIATGLVVVGDLVGSGEAQERGIVGETPNLAARLQGIAQPNMVVVAESTRRLLGNLFELEHLGPQNLKGITGPVPAFAALRPNSVESRFEAMRTASLTALVGREEESELLMRRWSKTRTGQGQVVLISGEAGIGKSRLTAALLDHLATEPHTRLRYFCSPQHTDSALYPIIGQMERAAGFVYDDKPQARLDKLHAVLGQTSAQDAALFAEMLSLPDDGRYPTMDLTSQQRRQTTLEALISQLEALARQSPVLMIFEDAHWTDPTSLELLGLVVDKIQALRVLLIVTFRPEFDPPWIGQPHVMAMTINRLNQHDVGAMIDRVIGDTLLPTTIRQDIIERTDGIPLFIEEMTKAVLEAESEGAARRTVAAAPSPTLAVPPSLHASLMARLDRLGPAKELAQIGAAIGREFSHALLAAVARKPEAGLALALDRLMEAGLLFRHGMPPHATYLFKHALVQDAAYGTLLREPRRALHARIAEALLESFPKAAETEPQIIAHHLTQAGGAEAAIEWWCKAGERARHRCGHAEAIAFLEKALGLAEEIPNGPTQRQLRLRLQITYGQALRTARGHYAAETTTAFARAYELAARTEDVTERLRMHLALGYQAFVRGELAMMQKVVQNFRVDAETLHGSHAVGVACRLDGQTCWFEGDYIGARSYLEKSLAVYGPEWNGILSSFEDIPALTAGFLPLVLWPIGEVELSRRLADDAVAQAIASGLIPSIMIAQTYKILFEAIRDDAVRAAPHVQALRDLCEEHGMPLGFHVASLFQGWMRWHAGDRNAGSADMQQALVRWREQEINLFFPLCGFLLAKTKLDGDQTTEGLHIVDDLLTETSRTCQRWFDAELHRLRGNILRRMAPANISEAEAEFRQALAVARAQKTRTFELRSALALGRLFRDTERGSLVSELLGPALSGFIMGPEVQEVEEAQVLLASVGGAVAVRTD